MNKLFLILSTITLGGVTSLISNLAQSVDQTESSTGINSILANPKTANIHNVSVNSKEANLILRTDPINLTALGIKNNSDLNQYINVELPEFTVTFGNYDELVTSEGYKWGAKMSEGEGDWALIMNANPVSGLSCTLERKHSLWYDEFGYNLALIYRLNAIARAAGGWNYNVNVKGQVGSVVKFY